MKCTLQIFVLQTQTLIYDFDHLPGGNVLTRQVKNISPYIKTSYIQLSPYKLHSSLQKAFLSPNCQLDFLNITNNCNLAL